MTIDQPVIVGSCNGILCLHDKENNDKEISLWNSLLRRRVIVPCHPPLKSPADKLGFGFGLTRLLMITRLWLYLTTRHLFTH